MEKESNIETICEILKARIRPIHIEKGESVILRIFAELKKACELANVHFLADEDGCYIYNKVCWQKISEMQLGNILKNAFVAMWAPKTEVCTYYGIENIVKQFKVEFYFAAKENNNAINFQNGTLEIDTLEFRRHKPGDYLKYALPYSYNPEAECPKWEKFLSEVLPSDELRNVAQEVAAYPLCGERLEKLLMCYGSGANGKSVYIMVLTAAYGEANCTSYSLENISRPDGLYIAMMAGKLANFTSENSTKILDSSILKSYISGEPIGCKQLYKNPIIIGNYAKTIGSCNELPVTSDHSNGFYRRMMFLPFKVTIPKDEQNVNLPFEVMGEELPGVFNWILSGVRRLRTKKSFSECREIAELVNEYRTDSDVVALWLKDEEYIPSEKDKVPRSIFYGKFKAWVFENGFKQISSKKFFERCRGLGFLEKKSMGVRYVMAGKRCEKVGVSEARLPF